MGCLGQHHWNPEIQKQFSETHCVCYLLVLSCFAQSRICSPFQLQWIEKSQALRKGSELQPSKRYYSTRNGLLFDLNLRWYSVSGQAPNLSVHYNISEVFTWLQSYQMVWPALDFSFHSLKNSQPVNKTPSHAKPCCETSFTQRLHKA